MVLVDGAPNCVAAAKFEPLTPQQLSNALKRFLDAHKEILTGYGPTPTASGETAK